jgi:hypothetical protein
MQKVLYVHIGTEKTRSTALQSVSGINRGTLMKHGILYPKTPGDRNHIRLAIFAADGKALNLRRLAGLVPDDTYKLFKTQFGDDLKSEVLASQYSRIYLSNEHLSSRIFSARAVSRLALRSMRPTYLATTPLEIASAPAICSCESFASYFSLISSLNFRMCSALVGIGPLRSKTVEGIL